MVWKGSFCLFCPVLLGSTGAWSTSVLQSVGLRRAIPQNTGKDQAYSVIEV